jgi:hypothetical protein
LYSVGHFQEGRAMNQALKPIDCINDMASNECPL